MVARSAYNLCRYHFQWYQCHLHTGRWCNLSMLILQMECPTLPKVNAGHGRKGLSNRNFCSCKDDSCHSPSRFTASLLSDILLQLYNVINLAIMFASPQPVSTFYVSIACCMHLVHPCLFKEMLLYP